MSTGSVPSPIQTQSDFLKRSSWMLVRQTQGQVGEPLQCCVFISFIEVFTSPPSSPPWPFVHWLGCFSPFCVSGPQPRWSSPDCLWSSRQAQRPVWLHTPTLSLRWDGGRAAWRDRRRKREGGVGGLVADTLSCPELLRVCLAYCPAAASFLSPSPTLSSPCCSPLQQTGSGGPDVDILLQALHMNLRSFRLHQRKWTATWRQKLKRLEGLLCLSFLPFSCFIYSLF